MDISSIFNSRDSIDFLVQQFMRFEVEPRDRLLDSRDVLTDRKSVLSELDSKLSALRNQADRLNSAVFDYFGAKTTDTSDPEKFRATAASEATIGNHSLSVQRLASSDTRVSNQFTDSGTSFSGFTTDQTFTIQVGSPTDADADNRVDISITVEASAFSGTDDAALVAVAGAINSAMNEAVINETIDNDEVVNASVVKEENGTSRLVLRSEKTGYTHRMSFGSSSLLDTLGVNSASQSSGVSGGYITEVGTSATDSELNTQFTMDGLTFYRDSNTIDDALDGLTLELLDTFTTNETLTISADVETVQGEIESFLEAYNEALEYLGDSTRGGEGRRAALADDVIYRGLVTDIRGIMTDVVSGTLTSNYDRLFNIGIEADSDGKLSIEDSEKLSTALKTNSRYVSDLFNSENGYSTRLESFIDGYVKAGGTISNSTSNIDNQIETLDNRIDLLNDLLVSREEQLRDELAEMQTLMTTLSGQQAFLGALIGGGF